jgi:hypothetical protein
VERNKARVGHGGLNIKNDALTFPGQKTLIGRHEFIHYKPVSATIAASCQHKGQNPIA